MNPTNSRSLQALPLQAVPFLQATLKNKPRLFWIKSFNKFKKYVKDVAVSAISKHVLVATATRDPIHTSSRVIPKGNTKKDLYIEEHKRG